MSLRGVCLRRTTKQSPRGDRHVRLRRTRDDVLFEIGTEELPATNLADIFENVPVSEGSQKAENVLEMRLRKILEEKRITFQNHTVWATPRRLVFIVKDVNPKQTAKDTFTKVLLKEDAYLPDGKPTEKLLTILKHRNTALKDTVIQPHQDKEYVFIKKTEPAFSTEKVLPEILRSLVKSLPFPKMMKWGKKWEDGSELYFPRPIRSFLCLYGDEALKFKIAEIPATDKISIFLKSQRKEFTVRSYESYEDILEKNGVILPPKIRKEKIVQDLEAQAKALKGQLHKDPFLLNEVNFLVENPNVLSASFDEKFLELPQEVLAVSMARKQRIFGVEKEPGKLLPVFIAVLDRGASASEKKLISNNIENILHAKLKDSLFFYQEDSKVPLEKKREELKNLIFLKGAGSMLEKSERLAKLAKAIQIEGFSDENRAKLERAAFLCKADLLTQMVGEFPELQGIMGKYYAQANGETAEVAQAIGEQYLPRTIQDKLPKTLIGSVLSMLDKIDLIVACFGLGWEPTSSLDPYGLRRSANAVVKICLENKLNFSFKFITNQNKALLSSYTRQDKEDTLILKLEDFFRDRFKAILTAEWGFPVGIIDAVCVSRPLDNFYKTMCDTEALLKISGEKSFLEAHKVIERLTNIIKGNKEALPSEINPSLFTEDLERQVFDEYNHASEAVRQAAESGDFRQATSLYATAFFDILNEFFEKVFVYCDDMNVRKNRLLLLKTVKELYTNQIADLSKIRL